MKCLLLAAGLGTRLRPYTQQIPKPLIPMLGVPIIYYSLYLLKNAGCKNVVVNLHHLPDKIKNQLKKNNLNYFDFEFSEELEAPLGSGGAIGHAKKHFLKEEHFFAINADEVMIPPQKDVLLKLINHHQEHQALATLYLTPHPQLLKTLRPVWVDSHGFVKGFGDHKLSSEPLIPYHYTGYKIFSSQILSDVPDKDCNIFYDILIEKIKAGSPVKAFVCESPWWETGNFNDFLIATGDLIKLLHRQKSSYLSDLLKEYDSSLNIITDVNGTNVFCYDSNTDLSQIKATGTVYLGKDLQLAKNISLENCIINNKSKINSNTSNTMIFGD